jgi:hypothetical protein
MKRALTTERLAKIFNVQHELVRDAAGALFQRTAGTFGAVEALQIRRKLVEWGYTF